MPKEIFDQERPRSAMARRLDEAFAGCEEWSLAPPSARRREPEVAPWLSSATAAIDPHQTAAQLPRAA